MTTFHLFSFLGQIIYLLERFKDAQNAYLPMYTVRTIFEVDIDGFEEKPWRLPGIDVTDFFNFGLNEDGWKDYCKQLVG